MRDPARGGRIFRRLLLASALATLPTAAYSLGLGTLVLKSALDQPLSAEIELISPNSKELRTLKASLASRDEFNRAGIDRPASLLNIRYEMFDRGGRHYLRLTTEDPFREPFLQLLINVEYSGGKLVREYSTLVDPPQWIANSAPVVAAAPAIVETPAPSAEQSLPPATEPVEPPAAVAQTEAVAPAPAIEPATPAEVPAPVAEQPREAEVPAEQAVASEPAAAPESEIVAEVPAPAVAPGTWASVSEYTVQRGDTLGAIAKRVRSDSTVSMEQVIVALFNANPDAFFKDNVNNLRTGRVLRVPEREAVDLVSRSEARAQIAAQNSVWREYRATLAAARAPVEIPDAVATADAPAAMVQPAKPAPKSASAAAPVKPAASGAAEELLQIVRSSEPTASAKTAEKSGTKSAGSAPKATTPIKTPAPVSDKVATLEEAVAARELENKALQERVGKAQQQIKNAQRLIDLENKGLATTQQDAAKKAGSEATAVPVPAPADVPVAEAAASAAAVAKPPRKRVIPPPAPIEQPGFLASFAESITGNPVTLAALGGVVVLGGGIGALYALRRRKAKTDFEESILSAGSATTDAGASAEGSMPTATDTSFLSDFSQGGMGNIHTDEVDPIAEAEVYLAYGRDEQAEEILKDAVVKDGKRHELRQKLAEIYFQRNDVRAFETVAEEMYAALEGKGGKAWDKVEELGRKIAPANPMFRARNADAVPVEEPAQFAMASQIASAGGQFGGGASASIEAGMDTASSLFDGGATDDGHAGAGSFDLDGGVPDSQDTGDIDFQLDAPGVKADPNWASAGSMDFDAADSDDRLVANSGNGAMGSDNSSNVLDFAPARAAASGETAPVAWDETATKLDLAKAYIDMGDAEGARSILDEVLSEGNDAQKKQAQDLARQIA